MSAQNLLYLLAIMLNWTRLLLIAVTIVIPGGLLLFPLLYKAFQKRTQASGIQTGLDFQAGYRRVPLTRAPPPKGRSWRNLPKASQNLIA